MSTLDELLAQGYTLEDSPSPVEQASFVNEQLLDSLRMVESNGVANAVSPKGAAGAYQFMPATAAEVRQELGFSGPYDPTNEAEQREMARHYLTKLERQFPQDPRLALAAYNAGAKRVQDTLDRVGGHTFDDLANLSPKVFPKETQQYVPKILSQLGQPQALPPRSAPEPQQSQLERLLAQGYIIEEEAPAVAPEAVEEEIIAPSQLPPRRRGLRTEDVGDFLAANVTNRIAPFADTLLAGTADELAGGLGGVVDVAANALRAPFTDDEFDPVGAFQKGYSETRDVARDLTGRGYNTNIGMVGALPGAVLSPVNKLVPGAGTGKVAAALGKTGLGAKALGAGKTAGRILAGAQGGARRAITGAATTAGVQGAAYGFASGEGGLEERAQKAGEMGTAAALTGGAIAGAGRTVKGLVGDSLDAIKRRARMLNVTDADRAKPMSEYKNLKRFTETDLDPMDYAISRTAKDGLFNGSAEPASVLKRAVRRMEVLNKELEDVVDPANFIGKNKPRSTLPTAAGTGKAKAMIHNPVHSKKLMRKKTGTERPKVVNIIKEELAELQDQIAQEAPEARLAFMHRAKRNYYQESYTLDKAKEGLRAETLRAVAADINEAIITELKRTNKDLATRYSKTNDIFSQYLTLAPKLTKNGVKKNGVGFWARWLQDSRTSGGIGALVLGLIGSAAATPAWLLLPVARAASRGPEGQNALAKLADRYGPTAAKIAESTRKRAPAAALSMLALEENAGE